MILFTVLARSIKTRLSSEWNQDIPRDKEQVSFTKCILYKETQHQWGTGSGPRHGFLGKGQIEFHIFIASGNRKKGLLKELLFFSKKKVKVDWTTHFLKTLKNICLYETQTYSIFCYYDHAETWSKEYKKILVGITLSQS